MTIIANNGLDTPASSNNRSNSGSSNNSKATQPNSSPTQSSNQVKNALILQAQLDVSLSSGNNSLALLYKTALESLGEALEPTLGANAIEQIRQRGNEYYTPEATAERIVQVSTDFFERYRENHPEQELEQQLDEFLALIGSGVDRGFTQAREILQGLEVLQGSIADNIDNTYQLVFAGYDQFRSAVLEGEIEPVSSKLTPQSSTSIEQYRTVAASAD